MAALAGVSREGTCLMAFLGEGQVDSIWQPLLVCQGKAPV
jgi:hypothetical protein